MSGQVASARLADLLNRYSDEEARVILGLNTTAVDRRRRGDGWTVHEAVKVAAASRVRSSEIFADVE